MLRTSVVIILSMFSGLVGAEEESASPVFSIDDLIIQRQQWVASYGVSLSSLQDTLETPTATLYRNRQGVQSVASIRYGINRWISVGATASRASEKSDWGRSEQQRQAVSVRLTAPYNHPWRLTFAAERELKVRADTHLRWLSPSVAVSINAIRYLDPLVVSVRVEHVRASVWGTDTFRLPQRTRTGVGVGIDFAVNHVVALYAGYDLTSYDNGYSKPVGPDRDLLQTMQLGGSYRLSQKVSVSLITGFGLADPNPATVSVSARLQF